MSAADEQVPLGVRLRRARRAAKLSQAEVARLAGVSQPLVSYYERSAGAAGGHGIAQIAAVLGLDPSGMERATADALPPASAGLPWLNVYRESLLASLQRVALDVACVDRPATGCGGDLGFAVELRSHVYLAVVDGTGRGDEAAVSALLHAWALLAAMELANGVVWPDELLDAVARVGRRAGGRRGAASFVALIDARHDELSWASIEFPPPWLRNGRRVTALRGERKGKLESGRMRLEPNWLLLVGSDGAAHVPSRDGVLWQTRAVRQLVSQARTAGELTHMLEPQLERRGARDDAFLLAVGRR